MNVNPYLFFQGQCEEALRFYADLLDGEILALLPYGPEGCKDMPEAKQDWIMHGCVKLDGTVLMGSDSPSERYQVPTGLSVSLEVDDPEQAEKVFEALSNGGSVTLPMEETFWALRFGMATDRFGIPWMVNCPSPEAGCPE